MTDIPDPTVEQCPNCGNPVDSYRCSFHCGHVYPGAVTDVPDPTPYEPVAAAAQPLEELPEYPFEVFMDILHDLEMSVRIPDNDKYQRTVARLNRPNVNDWLRDEPPAWVTRPVKDGTDVPDPTVEADEPCERCGLIEACMCGEPRHDL